MKLEYNGIENNNQLEEPPQEYLELLKNIAYSYEEIKYSWNTLIEQNAMRGISREEVIEAINDFNISIKNLIGQKINNELFTQIYLYADRLNDLIGIELNAEVPIDPVNNEFWSYREQKEENEFNRFERYLEKCHTVIWTVESMRRDFPHLNLPEKVKKKDLMKILENLQKEKEIVLFEKNSIYCGPIQTKKSYFFDCDFGHMVPWDMPIPFEQSQGDSYQKNRKPFKVLVQKNTEGWQEVENYFWDIDKNTWRELRHLFSP